MKRLILCFAIVFVLLALLFTGCRQSVEPDIGLNGNDHDIPVSPTDSEDKELEDETIDKVIDGNSSDTDPGHTEDPETDEPVAEPELWKVLFRDRSGNLIATVEVEDGKDAVAPEVPFDEDYRFVSWDKELTNVTSNRIITALYEKRSENDPARLRYSDPDEDGNCALTGIGSYTSSTLELPTVSPDGFPVTSIAKGAFSGEKSIERLILPKGSYVIEEEAFAKCLFLSELVIDEFPEKVAENAFRNCLSLSSLVIGDEVINLEDSYAGWLKEFRYSILSLTLGKAVDYIENDFFKDFVKLVDLHNNSHLKIKKGSTADGCVGLHLLEEADDSFHSILKDGAFFFYFNEENELFYLLGSLAPSVLENYTDEDDLPDEGTFSLPEGCGERKYDYFVYSYAFFGRSDIQNLVIPLDAVRIDAYAFADCKNMQSITFDLLPRLGIEKYAFKDATALRLRVNGKEYSYRFTNPEEDGYWHYSYGVPTIWKPGDNDDGEELVDPMFDDQPLVPLNGEAPETE